MTEITGIPTTAPIRTLADLAAVADERTLERAVARAERNGQVTVHELGSLVDQMQGRVGGPVLRAVVHRPGGTAFTRSEAEDRFLALIRETPIAPPRVNAVVLGQEVDFYWAAHGLVVEVDGYAYHGSRPRFVGDRRRDGRFAAHGIRVLRFTWDQIVHDERGTLVILAQVLARADGGGVNREGGKRS